MPRFIHPTELLLVLALAAAAAPACLAEDDVFTFILDNGGQIRGHWRNLGERPLSAYEIETEQGVRLTLEKPRVRKTIRRQPAELEYERIASRYADTAEAQWELAQWCRDHGLKAQREQHLQRVIALDPDHVEARRLLGYRQIGGQWMTPSQHLREQGYQVYRGRWRLAQEIELMERDRRKEEARKEWVMKLKRWRSDLNTGDARLAADRIRAVRDPPAADPLAQMLEKESSRRVKLLYIDSLGKIPGDRAAGALIDASLNDSDEEVFRACVDEIVDAHPPQAVGAYIKALKSPRNSQVNRAAYALSRLGEASAMSPLIDALVTTHARVIRDPAGRSPDTITTTFTNVLRDGQASPSGGMGLATGGRDRVIRRQVANSEVLRALVQLAGGANFGYDRQAWEAWLAMQQDVPTSLDGRRDEPARNGSSIR